MPYTAPWPAPARNLALLHLVGDCQTDWETIYPGGGATIYDAVGRDMRDHMVLNPPDVSLQMGDVSDGNADFSQATLFQRFALFNQWLGDYDLNVDTDWHMVMGNHDIVGYIGEEQTLDAYGWAAFWGYPQPSYVVDLGAARVIVLNPTGTGEGMNDPLVTAAVTVRPLTPADIAWLDARLTEDTRPTLLAVHAPPNGAHGDFADRWSTKQSTEQFGLAANDLKAVLNAHPHCIGWVHGHTHNPYDVSDPNTSLLDIGSREIAVVDAAALYQRPSGERTLPLTFYVSILDDGKTLDVRWRQHGDHRWTAVGSNRFVQLTAT